MSLQIPLGIPLPPLPPEIPLPPLGIECPWHGTCHTAVSLALTVRLQGRSIRVQDLACFCGKKAGSPSALGQPALVHRLTPGQGGASLGLWLAGHGLIALQNSQISSSWIQWGFIGWNHREEKGTSLHSGFTPAPRSRALLGQQAEGRGNQFQKQDSCQNPMKPVHVCEITRRPAPVTPRSCLDQMLFTF